jgi:hypothetical protein
MEYIRTHEPEGVFVDDAEVLTAFGRDVDVAVRGERRSADPEHFLVEDPFFLGIGDGFVVYAHLCDRDKSWKKKSGLGK